jgi:hypothetical protein
MMRFLGFACLLLCKTFNPVIVLSNCNANRPSERGPGATQ